MRDNSVSISKGIGIFLMVLAHTQFSDYGNTWINMFHMPLFFFVSGYCFKEKYIHDFKTFAVKRIKGCWWPYVKYSLLFTICHNLFYKLHFYDMNWGGVQNSLFYVRNAESLSYGTEI